jgi:hypothetical protein
MNINSDARPARLCVALQSGQLPQHDGCFFWIGGQVSIEKAACRRKHHRQLEQHGETENNSAG